MLSGLSQFASWTFTIYFTFTMLSSLYQLCRTSRIYRTSRRKVIATMWELTSWTPKILMMITSFFFIPVTLYFLIYLYKLQSVVRFFYCLYAATLTFIFLNLTLPGILFLSASSTVSHLLLEDIREELTEKTLRGSRVVSLIVPDALSSYSRNKFDIDSFRTIDERKWLSSVNRIMSIVPIIILDTRVKTEALNQEINIILDDPRFLNKTYFIVKSNKKSMHLDLIDLSEIFERDMSLLENDVKYFFEYDIDEYIEYIKVELFDIYRTRFYF